MTSAENGAPAPHDLTETLDTIRDFFASHPEVKLPHNVSLVVDVATRAELAALAGDFDRAAPEEASHYKGAQFSVEILAKPYVTVLFSHYRGSNL
jgi:hypothetical protein